MPPRRTERIVVFIFGAVFVSLLIVLAVFFPVPTPFQYTVFRIVLALAAAGVAAYIPGFINVTVNDWVRAGGALAVFVIVYFFSPATLVYDSLTFPLTVYVHGEHGPHEVVLSNSGKVVLRLGVEPKSEPIGADGEAFFPAIPANFRDQTVPVWVAESNEFETDANTERLLRPPSIDITVRKKSGKVSGRIEENEDTFVPISGAEIRIAGLTVKSGPAGDFEVTISGDEMQSQLGIDISAHGFLPLHTTVVPNSNAAVIKLTRRH